MNATRSRNAVPRQPTPVHMLAHLLERLDCSLEPVGADQYRAVAQQLAQQLDAASAGPELTLLLNHYPSAAELYENLHYGHAGLCRSPLDQALDAEIQTRDTIAKARHTSGFTNRDLISGKK